MDYPVPDFGLDEDIRTTHKNENDAKSRLGSLL
jgi:hypothetical protein